MQIKKYKTIEAIRNSLQDDCKKLSIPYTTEEYTTVKEFFKNPDVTERSWVMKQRWLVARSFHRWHGQLSMC